MSVWKKILTWLKYFGMIAGATAVIWKTSSFFADMKNDMVNYNRSVIDTISELRKDFIRYQVETNTNLTLKTGQIGDIIESLEKLDRNQKIIILKSDESQKILEEIKNQQLINGVVDINYLDSKNAYVVQVKKKESEL
jgi:site-specific DNA-adenine methylase